MAWNEPGGGNNGNRDPWNNNKGGDQGPPDLDEVVKKLQDKMGNIFGGKKGGGNSGGNNTGSSGGGFGGVGIIVVVVAVLFAALQSFYTIQPAERGVVKRFGAYSSTTAPGPHLKIPFVDSVDVVNVDQVNKFVHRAQMLTRDENIADVTLEVQFRISDAADFLFQDSDPAGTIHNAIESSLREVVGKNNLDGVITENRSAIADDVRQGTQRLLDLYRTGLIITSVNIQKALAPDQVQAAFDDAIKAREDKEGLQNKAEAYANDVVPRARGGAARQLEDAVGYKAKTIAEAEGESARFVSLLTEFEKAPKVTRERLYIETMQDVLANSGKVMLDVKDGSNMTYLPLDRMVQPPKAAVKATSAFDAEPVGASPSAISAGAEDLRRRFDRSRSER